MFLPPVAAIVEAGVPIPEAKCRRKYPWREMQIGDSFLAPHAIKAGDIGVPQAVRNTGRRFTTRKTRDGLRVWRIA